MRLKYTLAGSAAFIAGLWLALDNPVMSGGHLVGLVTGLTGCAALMDAVTRDHI
jgi:hypothetical protein